MQENRAGHLTAGEWMTETNRRLIRGLKLSDAQRRNIAARLLAAKSAPWQARRFYSAVHCPGNIAEDGGQPYPLFFIPPEGKGESVLGQAPKTRLFSANLYELEILRLLLLLAPDDPEVGGMAGRTLERLKTTRFGNGDSGDGESFDISLVALRFLAAAAPGETDWIKGRMANYRGHAQDQKRAWQAEWYYWLCLSELPFALAKPEAERDRGKIMPWLTTKSAAMNSERDKAISPVLLCILRNLMGRYPEYAYIRERRPYVSRQDGRLHFSIA